MRILCIVAYALFTLATHAQNGASVAEALRLAAEGRSDEAEQMLANLNRADSGNPEIQYRYGLLLLRNGKLAAARQQLESAARLAPDPLVWLALAQVRLRLNDLPGALAAAGRARAGNSSQPAVGRALSLFDAEVIKFHLQKGQAHQAADLARKAIAASDLAVFHNLLGKAHELNRDTASAAAEMQQAIRLDPNQAGWYLDLAQLFLNHNTPEPAELVLADAVRRFPNHAEAMRLLGVARYALGKTDQALEAFLSAIDAAPGSEAAYASLETLLPDAGARLAEIIPRLRRFEAGSPSSPLGPYLLALVLPDEAETLLRKSIRAAPDFWPAWFELHKILRSQDKWDEAAAALQKTIALNPDFPAAHYALGEYYSRTADYERAAQERERHHKLLTEQQAAAQRQRAEAPRLTYTLSER
jgi:tetratricopeptide (TPR) repeat protein